MRKPMDSDDVSLENFGRQSVEATLETSPSVLQLTPDDIYKPITPNVMGLYEQPRLFLDGYVFLEPASELFKDSTRYNAVPIITGTNRDESKLFMIFDEQWVDLRFGFLPKAKNVERYNAFAAYGADTWRVLAAEQPAELITRNGGAPVYTYRFDFDDMSTAVLDLPLLIGAGHGMETPFIFGFLDDWPFTWMFSNREQRSDLSQSMRNYWGAFARTGDPGEGGEAGQQRWTAWQANGDHIMLLDTENDGGVRMSNQPLRVEDIKQRLFNDPLFSMEERCNAYPELFLNGYMVADAYDHSEHQSLCKGEAGTQD